MGFAVLLLSTACATNDTASQDPKGSDDLVHVTNSGSVNPASGPALVDSTGAVYSSSAAPGAGNASTTGTNTNVNLVPSTEVQQPVAPSTDQVIDTTATVETTSTTTVRTEPEPMTSTTQSTTVETVETPETVDDEPAPTRTRMRKD